MDHTNSKYIFKKAEKIGSVTLIEDMFVFWNERNSEWIHKKRHFWSKVGDFLWEIISVLHEKSTSGKMSESGIHKTVS
jgi:hypothetical protein